MKKTKQILATIISLIILTFFAVLTSTSAYGQCAPNCLNDSIGDTFCNPYCYYADCNWDGGDCNGIPFCTDGCPENYVGDDVCDPACNVAACNFDGGDCEDENPFLVFKDYNLPIWDFSGTYDEQTVPHGIANFTLVQDAKGKITGSGNKSYYSFAEGINIENIALDIKGKVKGKKGTVTVKIKTKGDSSASDDGKSYNIKSKDKITLGLNAEKDALVGTSKGKVCAKGKGCESGSNNIEIVLLPGMTGAAVVLIDSDNQTGKFSGNGKLILSNDDEYSLSYKAKHNSNKGETKYQLKGKKGIKFKLKMNASDNATQINGKAFGQKLKYKK